MTAFRAPLETEPSAVAEREFVGVGEPVGSENARVFGAMERAFDAHGEKPALAERHAELDADAEAPIREPLLSRRRRGSVRRKEREVTEAVSSKPTRKIPAERESLMDRRRAEPCELAGRHVRANAPLQRETRLERPEGRRSEQVANAVVGDPRVLRKSVSRRKRSDEEAERAANAGPAEGPSPRGRGSGSDAALPEPRRTESSFRSGSEHVHGPPASHILDATLGTVDKGSAKPEAAGLDDDERPCKAPAMQASQGSTPGKGERDGSSWVVIVAIFAAVFAIVVLPKLREARHALVGQGAPALSLPLLAGGPAAPAVSKGGAVDLASLRGHVVVLDFWAPWCGPCKMEMPHLQALSQRRAADGVVVVGVLVDEDRTGAAEVVSQLRLTYPQLDDDRHQAAEKYEVRSLPTLVVLDKQGVVKTYRTGFTEEAELDAAIDAALR